MGDNCSDAMATMATIVNKKRNFPTFETEEKKDRAFIVDFPYGGKALADRKSKVKFGYYKSTSNDINKKKQRLLVAETEDMHYMDKNSMAATNYMIGVYDRRTGKVQLIDAQYYMLRVVAKDELDIEDADKNEKLLSYHQKSERLVKEFGSSKGKRLVNSRLRNEVKGDALVSAIGSAVQDVSVNLGNVSTATTDVETNLMPICHKDATNVRDVYLLDDSVISPAEMLALCDCASVFVDSNKSSITTWRAEKTYPMFILERLEYLSNEEVLRSHRARCLTYLYYLYVMFQMKRNDISKKNPLSPAVPEIIRKKLLNQFTLSTEDGKGRSLR